MEAETKNTKPADEEIEKTAEPTAGEEKQPETETDVELQAGMKNEMQAGAQSGMKNEMQTGVQVETQNEMQAGMQDSKTFICRFRLEKPVYVDEKLQIQARTEHGKQIYECKREDREIVWKMRIL